MDISIHGGTVLDVSIMLSEVNGKSTRISVELALSIILFIGMWH